MRQLSGILVLAVFALAICSSHARKPRFDPFVTYEWQEVYDDKLYMNTRDPGAGQSMCDKSVKQLVGYYSAGGDKKYFFWLFEARKTVPKDSPTVMWLTGGPGCSSMMALFTENGPCTVNPEGTDTIPNPYSWTERANVFWVDQPPGTGFSEGSYDQNEDGVALDMHAFLEALFKAKPEYNNRFYISGESYAGHYIPAIANYIFEQNKGTGFKINMAGVAIGNGWTDPELQFASFPEMAYKSTTTKPFVSEAEYKAMVAVVPACQQFVNLCDTGSTYSCYVAEAVCEASLMGAVQAHNKNPYDLRLDCGDKPLCYDNTNLETFLNDPKVKQNLGVNPDKEWAVCDTTVYINFLEDFVKSFHKRLVPLIEAGVPVLIYAGDQDYICNWIGVKSWTLALEWSGQKKFNAAQDLPYKLPSGKDIGLRRSAGSFTFLQVFEAGHMVPMDQPEAALFMINDFIHQNSALTWLEQNIETASG